MAETQAYCQAASTGKYEKPSGILGKYDNVRRFWEDQLTTDLLAPALNDLLERRGNTKDCLRVLDLGCGSGDGYELLTCVPRRETSYAQVNVRVINDNVLGNYLGLDINPDLIGQAELCHGANPKVRFVEGDLTQGLPRDIAEQEPFDLYFAGDGTLSHFHDNQTAQLIADIASHAADGSVFIGDWLGRYSYEWQDLWQRPNGDDYFMDYRISYIYSEEERARVEVSSFPLRLMSRDEVLNVARRAEEMSGVELVPLTLFDRSILIGRHMETGDYNPHCKPVRTAVNSLFEPHLRTDLSALTVHYVPKDGFEELNSFFQTFYNACNELVDYTAALLDACDGPSPGPRTLPEPPQSDLAPLTEAMQVMRRTVDNVTRIGVCDARANFIEPMLAYCLRKLEMDVQTGAGVGHGLVGVFQVKKGR